jgi:diguanylate cyclase (GGDEF)-like protein
MDNEFKHLSTAKVLEHYSLLQEMGVFHEIDDLKKEIRDYKQLVQGAYEIFNRQSIDDILDATVHFFSDRFLPTFIMFMWRPRRNLNDITVRGFQSSRQMECKWKVPTLAPFEAAFNGSLEPKTYLSLRSAILETPGMEETIEQLDRLTPNLAVPIQGPGQFHGMILVGHRILEQQYSEKEMEQVGLLMSLVSQAIQNNLNFEHSVRDVKTGLYNHGFFFSRVKEEIARVRRSGKQSSIIIIDIDKFKKYNDTYGHLAGDRVLECLADVLKSGVRDVDIVSRFGGEEFTVLLPDANRTSAWMVAERLRKTVEKMFIPWVTPIPQITISLGVLTFDDTTGLEPEEVFGMVDKALYVSKRSGRNRSTMWKGGLYWKINQNTMHNREQLVKVSG